MRPPPEDASIVESLDGARRRLLGLPHVVGVGLGWKETGGRVTGRAAWRVYVAAKRPAGALRLDERVPPAYAGLATDVVAAATALTCGGAGETGPGLDEEGPLAPGATVSNLRGLPREPGVERHDSGLGTLGFLGLVNGTRHRTAVLVSNRHVLLAHGAGRGDPIYRPLLAQHGATWVIRAGGRDPVAEILDEGAETNHPFRYPDEPPAEYFVDCATARLLGDHGAGARPRVRGAARLHPLDVVGGRAPRVRKLGGATGITFGRVVDVAAPVNSADGQRRLGNIVVRGTGGDFTGPGDSGALLLNDRDEAVGLVWGRNERDPGVAYASHIHPVLDWLHVTMMSGDLV
jgi:hypothetical protein